MSLHAEKVTRANGTTEFRLRYWIDYKHKTIPITEHPSFKSIEEARAFCKKQNGKAHAERHLEKHAKGMDSAAFKKKYADFEKDVAEFVEWYRDEAPNSWETSRSWLQNFIVPYFLGKNLNNPNLWHTEFESFRKWLEREATVSSGRKLLSYSSRGHIIKALNCYLKYLGLHNKMDAVTSNVKCRGFKRSLSNRRGKEDLFQPSEYAGLLMKLGDAKQFFTVLINTGLRIHELYSLQFSNVFQGTEDLDADLVKPFEQMGATIYGYIRLESQMKLKVGYRNNKNGSIKRKPLKSKPRISPEFNRIIPIIDKACWDALVENRRRAMKDWKAAIHTSTDPDDYLLFDLDINAIRRDMRLHTKKTPHCCRHTYATNTVKSFRGVNYGPELIKGITGHSSVEFERYVHLSLENEQNVKKRKLESF